MDKSIKKSIYDKEIESFIYNPQIIVNKKSKNIKNRLSYFLKISNRFDIAVSYVVWSGLQLIIDHFKKYDHNSRMIITTEGLVTDPRSLRALYNLNIKVKVYDPNITENGFHLKSFLFSQNEKSTLLVGSSNISSRAFGKVHEMLIEVDAFNEGKLIDEYQNTFEEIWNNKSAVFLTKEFIENYTEMYNYKTKMLKYYDDFNLEKTKIIPNYMQQEALKSLKEARKEYDRGLVIAATGTGKTFLSAFDVKAFQAKKVLFLVHNRLILNDAIKSYKKIFNKKIIELKSSNINEINNFDIIFTTDKTAYSYLYQKVDKDYFDYIIYDEAHKIGEHTQYNDLINYFKPKFSLGMTATPERTDNPRFLFETFKYNVPYEIRLLDSLEAELVCPFTYYGLDLNERLLKDNEEFDYPKLALYIKETITNKGHYGEKLKALIFAQNIKEANKVSKELAVLGYKSVSAVSGSSNQEEIENYIESLKSDDKDSIEIITTVNKFNEGIDIPDINVIIMLRNTTSAIIYLQQLGRGLRKTVDPNKFVTVFDIIGNSKNNYTIAEVLTGNETKDKRLLYKHINTNFETVSSFINVKIEKQA
ncbi:MAG: DEAD/DEAH box helicase family protein, partial [Acholeplasmataceae bacterium]